MHCITSGHMTHAVTPRGGAAVAFSGFHQSEGDTLPLTGPCVGWDGVRSEGGCNHGSNFLG